MMRFLTSFVAGVLAASQLAACGGNGGGEAADDRIARCTRGIARVVVLKPNRLDEQPTPQLIDAAESMCREAESEGLLTNEKIALERRMPLLRKHATDLYAQVCDRLAATIREATPKKVLRYLTDDDFSRYANGVCAVIGNYLHENGSVDERLFVEHPELLESWCAASFSAIAADRPAMGIPKSNLRAYGKTLCARLVEQKLIAAKGAVEFRVRPGYGPVMSETIQDFQAH
jgi:hypothetical protein